MSFTSFLDHSEQNIFIQAVEATMISSQKLDHRIRLLTTMDVGGFKVGISALLQKLQHLV